MCIRDSNKCTLSLQSLRAVVQVYLCMPDHTSSSLRLLVARALVSILPRQIMISEPYGPLQQDSGSQVHKLRRAKHSPASETTPQTTAIVYRNREKTALN
eukprot:5315459-Amphidinium_carterae.1